MHPRILLADDHDITRNVLRKVLEDTWTICGDATDGIEAVSKAVYLRPDLVLMDVSMPRMSGIAASKEIHLLCPETKILILTLYESDRMRVAAAQAGAVASLAKEASIEQMKEAIAEALSRETSANRECEPEAFASEISALKQARKHP